LLQISPNCFLGNWTLDPRRKWALVIICQRKEVHCKGYTASVAHPWALAVYHQFSLKSMEIPYVSVLYKLLKTYHLALIPFNFGAKGSKASVAHPLGPGSLPPIFIKVHGNSICLRVVQPVENLPPCANTIQFRSNRLQS
jgi:hypothetical protein